MVVVTTTGYFVTVLGPYLADSKNNDAAILKHMFNTNVEDIKEWVQDNDIFVVDRGFRDSLELLDDLGIKAQMPSFFIERPKQMTTDEANASRLVTKVRWVVESANARIKRWKYLSHVLPNKQVPYIGDYVCIVCGISNKYLPPLSPGCDNEEVLAAKMLHLSKNVNTLKQRVEEENFERRKTIWKEPDNNLDDFPRLDEEDLRNITCGVYQMKLSTSYIQEHLEGNCQILVHQEDEHLIRVKLQSRHVSSKSYILWIEYTSAEITAWYCKCRAGARVVVMAKSMKYPIIRKAQVLVACYFCKEQAIKWRCEDCNIRMCNTCKVTVHQGLTSAQDNVVVSIQDISMLSLFSQEVTPIVISSVCYSYTTTLPAVHTLPSSDDDLLYISYFCFSSKDRFVKGKLLQSSIKILLRIKKNIFDIAINKDGEILFNEYGDNKINFLSPAGEVNTVLDTSPMRPLAIHVNKDNEEIIGLQEQGPPFPVQDFSTRQVIILSSDYQRKVGIRQKGRLNDDNNARIVTVDRNGHFKFMHDGPKDYETFNPQGITITPSDTIVVADSSNDSLHVLNSKGELLCLQSLHKDLGIEYPKCVFIDREGFLLIGCANGRNEAYGKIHVVKMKDSLM
ncbi:unnamed protein product [Mytilus coruscus]|uniref:B box-type domain-containing protein n=1 Tax=Mytilus coruscus TaxID=42192 RepID=A0A6J8B1F9_MYTCO|nr:unnamed protein product [Mytilus coruscus]